MNLRKDVLTSILFTAVTAVIFGLVYPLLITGVAQLTMRDKANGQLLRNSEGAITGAALIGQPFTGPGYFHSRPSFAGSGYDATSSSGSNYGPTSQALREKVNANVKAESDGRPVPVDLVTASASGLDPDISPAAASYQVTRVAQERHLPEPEVQRLVQQATEPRQLGLFGEPRVNVLTLNLALDRVSTHTR